MHRLLLHDTVKFIHTENTSRRKYRRHINKMILLILLLTNIISIVTSTLVTFIATCEMYSESPENGHPLHGAGALGLGELQERALHGLGELQSHDSLQGLQHHHLGVSGRMGENVEKGVDEERVGEHPKRSGLSETTHGRIDIHIDGRTSKKNQTHTIEMSDMWAD